MTQTPELTEDPLAPLVRYLRADPELMAFRNLIPPQGSNPVLGPPISMIDGTGISNAWTGDTSPWIFRNFETSGSPYANVEGTGSCAITLTHAGPWSRVPRGSTITFPEIRVYYHCDPTRDPIIGAPIIHDARDKCFSLHKAVKKLLNLRDLGSESYKLIGARPDGTHALKLVSAELGRELSITPFPSGDGMVEGSATFELSVKL